MDIRRLKVAAFKNATLATLMTAVNDFTAGKAVAIGDSGTVAYGANAVGESTLIDQQYMSDGTNHMIVLFYA